MKPMDEITRLKCELIEAQSQARQYRTSLEVVGLGFLSGVFWLWDYSNLSFSWLFFIFILTALEGVKEKKAKDLFRAAIVFSGVIGFAYAFFTGQ